MALKYFTLLLLILFLNGCAQDRVSSIVITKVSGMVFIPKNLISQNQKKQRMVGGKIYLQKNECKSNKELILGKIINIKDIEPTWIPIEKLVLALDEKSLEAHYQYWQLDENKNYQYRPEYDVKSVPAGRYRICGYKLFSRKRVELENEYYIDLPYNKTVYIGDIIVDEKKLFFKSAPEELFSFLDKNLPDLSLQVVNITPQDKNY